jgi:hypothetical protein
LISALAADARALDGYKPGVEVTYRSVGTFVTLAVALCGLGLRAQASQPDTLPVAARDSVLDAALADVVMAHQLVGRVMSCLSPYRVLDDSASDAAPMAPHDPTWLRRAQDRHHFTAICAAYGPDRRPPRNGAIYVTLTTPRPHASGAAIGVSVFSVLPSETERHAAETDEYMVYLEHTAAGWRVYRRGIHRHDEGILTDPLPLR